MTDTRSTELQCRWSSWQVLDEHSLRLQLRKGNCCDMQGAIAIAERLMPGVIRILTYSGADKDTEYRRDGPTWRAILWDQGFPI